MSRDSSSSEDEACLRALKEATDHDFLKNSFYDKKVKKEENLKSSENETTLNEITVDNSCEYENHGLSQSCRSYIFKKLNERLER